MKDSIMNQYKQGISIPDLTLKYCLTSHQIRDILRFHKNGFLFFLPNQMLDSKEYNDLILLMHENTGTFGNYDEKCMRNFTSKREQYKDTYQSLSITELQRIVLDAFLRNGVTGAGRAQLKYCMDQKHKEKIDKQRSKGEQYNEFGIKMPQLQLEEKSKKYIPKPIVDDSEFINFAREKGYAYTDLICPACQSKTVSKQGCQCEKCHINYSQEQCHDEMHCCGRIMDVTNYIECESCHIMYSAYYGHFLGLFEQYNKNIVYLVVNDAACGFSQNYIIGKHTINSDLASLVIRKAKQIWNEYYKQHPDRLVSSYAPQELVDIVLQHKVTAVDK